MFQGKVNERGLSFPVKFHLVVLSNSLTQLSVWETRKYFRTRRDFTWLPFWLVCCGSDRSPSRLSKSRADPIMVVWSRSKGDSGDSPPTMFPSCKERLREDNVLLLTDFCTDFELSLRSCELLCWSRVSGSPILISLNESLWLSLASRVSGSVEGGAIICRCSWERDGGAPWEEHNGGGFEFNLAKIGRTLSAGKLRISQGGHRGRKRGKWKWKDKATNCAGRRSWPPKINISELIWIDLNWSKLIWIDLNKEGFLLQSGRHLANARCGGWKGEWLANCILHFEWYAFYISFFAFCILIVANFAFLHFLHFAFLAFLHSLPFCICNLHFLSRKSGQKGQK